jgi:hypothetical protein
VVHILSQVTEESEPLSILDLQGLGKELWHKTRATRHVREERPSGIDRRSRAAGCRVFTPSPHSLPSRERRA